MNKLIRIFSQREVFSDGTEGDTLLECLLSALAFVAFICLIVWILGETPSIHERMHSEAHDVITFTDKDDGL